MRKRPEYEHNVKKYLEGAEASVADNMTVTEDMHKYLYKISWPLKNEEVLPSFGQGSSLRKPMTLALTEKEWNSIDRHTKVLGISKTEWIRYALFKLMQEEQLYCFKNKP